MADIKFTGLAAATPPIDAGSLVAFSTKAGAVYTSEKVTLTQLRDAVYLMEAEQLITFDSSGSKTFLESGNVAFVLNAEGDDDTLISSSGGGYSTPYLYTSASESILSGGSGYQINAGTTRILVKSNATVRIEADATGLGFFNATPIAKPTAAVSAAGIHAALVSLGLIA